MLFFFIFQILGFTVIEILKICFFELNEHVRILSPSWWNENCLCGPAAISKWESAEEWPTLLDRPTSNYDFKLNQGRLSVEYYYKRESRYYEVRIYNYIIPSPRRNFPLKMRWFKKDGLPITKFGFWPK